MEPTYNTTHSCGVGQLEWIADGGVTESRVRRCLLAPAQSWTQYGAWSPPRFTGVAQITFIDVRYNNPRYREAYPSKNGETGRAIADYINKNGLGTVTSGKWTTNPVHMDRKIKTYVWSIDPEGYAAWVDEQPEYQERVNDGRGDWA